MKRLWAGLIVLGALVAMTTPASAGESITVSGDFAPGGTVTVSGNGCFGTDQADQQVPGEVTVRIFGGNPLTNVAFVNNVVSPPPGDWSVDLTISPSAVPGEQYTVSASCDRTSIGEPISFDYPEVLQIMGEPVTPSTDTTASSDTTSSTDPGAQAAAANASTSPRFTG
jgi:hypothetical protein